MKERQAELLDVSDSGEDLLTIIAKFADPESGQYRFPPAMQPPAGSDASDQIADSKKLHRQGYTGKGCLVGLIDTGIDEQHPLLRGTVLEWRDFTGGGSGADQVGHGTLVALIIHYVAPAARFIVAKVTNGRTCDEQILASAIDWVATHKPIVINMSMGISEPDPVQRLYASPLRWLVRGKPRPHPLVRALRRHWLHRCPVCDAADAMLRQSPGTELCLAVGNQRGRVFCPGRGRNLGLSIGASVWRGSRLGAPDYSNAWPDMVAPEMPLAPGTSFSVPWMTGLICLLGEVANVKRRPVDSQQVPERETAYKTLLSRWFEPEDFEILVADLRTDLAEQKISPDAAIAPLWDTAQSPRHLLALLDILEPYKEHLSPESYGQMAVLRSVALVDAGRYQEGLDTARQVLNDPSFPVDRRAEVMNAEGRCLFHLADFAASIAAYQAALEAAGRSSSFRAQLYINLGNAMQGDIAAFVKNREAAIAALEQGVLLADSPRLKVEGRSSLSTAYINGGEFDPAMRVLQEAWQIAEGNHYVADKARVMVLRNIAIVQILKGLRDQGIATMEQAIGFAISYYGPCHPEMISLYRLAFALYVEGLFSGSAITERMLRVLQTAQRANGVGGAAAKSYLQITLENLVVVARRQGVEEKMPEIRQRLNSYATKVLDDRAIAGIVALVVNEA